MKQKKILLVLSSVAIIIMTALFMQSCNRDYEQIDPLSTKADALVTSTDFQEFQENLEAFAKDLRTKYMNLSESDRKQFNEILSGLADQNTVDSKELYEKATSIIGIDIELQQKKFRKHSAFLNSAEAHNISQKDLVTAIKRHELAGKNTTIRLKSGSEGEDPKVQVCKDNCNTNFLGCSVLAALLVPPADVGAFLICVVLYNSCLGTCE